MSDPDDGDELLRIVHYGFWYELLEALSRVRYGDEVVRGMRALVGVSRERDGGLGVVLEGIPRERRGEGMDDLVVLLGKMGIGGGGRERDIEMADA